VYLELLGKLKKIAISSVARDLLACSIVPQPTTLHVINLGPCETSMLFLTCFVRQLACILFATLSADVYNIPYILLPHKGYCYITNIYVQISAYWVYVNLCRYKWHCNFIIYSFNKANTIVKNRLFFL
jgi:hypothetical protein